MLYDKVLSKVYKAKVAKGICLARCYTVSDWKSIPEIAHSHWQIVAANRESCQSDVSMLRCDVRCIVPRASIRGSRSQYFANQAHPSISDYVIMLQHAINYKVSNALRTLRGPPQWPHRGDRLLQPFYWTVLIHELMNFRSCKLANLIHQKSFSCADSGSISVFHCQSVMVGQHRYCKLWNTNILVWHADLGET